MSLIIVGAVEYLFLDETPTRDATRCTVRYTTDTGLRVVRTFELDRPNRKVWEVGVQMGDAPHRKVRRPVYRGLDLRGEIVPVTDQSTIRGLLTAEVARNRSRSLDRGQRPPARGRAVVPS